MPSDSILFFPGGFVLDPAIHKDTSLSHPISYWTRDPGFIRDCYGQYLFCEKYASPAKLLEQPSIKCIVAALHAHYEKNRIIAPGASDGLRTGVEFVADALNHLGAFASLASLNGRPITDFIVDVRKFRQTEHAAELELSALVLGKK